MTRRAADGFLTRTQKSALRMIARKAGRPRQVTVDALVARGLVEDGVKLALTQAGVYAERHGVVP